ncbi:MAG: pyrroline-5-carboxylate reductase [Synechococcales cyanobacterium CRU_2_2]|nr:pyrroline-5-carboxylate reductase [Synechococcales cyanobacterium CRU_2_2]
MLQDRKIALVGCGTMGEAILQCLLAQGVATAAQISASVRSEARCSHLRHTYGIEATTCNIQAVQAAAIVLLGVKPQALPTLMPMLIGNIPPDALVLSIAAGITVQTLHQGLNHAAIVRAMPNTPAQVGRGMTVWYAASAVTRGQRSQTIALLQALGKELEVQQETTVDQATALSGAGPGFIFLVIEAMVDAGVQMGLNHAQAQTLTLETIAGSVELLRQTQQHPASLRNQVTSPGGATAAGLYELEKGGLRTTICNAILAAFQRTQQLSQPAPAKHEHGSSPRESEV